MDLLISTVPPLSWLSSQRDDTPETQGFCRGSKGEKMCLADAPCIWSSQVRTSLFLKVGKQGAILDCLQFAKSSLHILVLGQCFLAPWEKMLLEGWGWAGVVSVGLLESGDISDLLQVPNALIVILLWEGTMVAIRFQMGLVFFSIQSLYCFVVGLRLLA